MDCSLINLCEKRTRPEVLQFTSCAQMSLLLRDVVLEDHNVGNQRVGLGFPHSPWKGREEREEVLDADQYLMKESELSSRYEIKGGTHSSHHPASYREQESPRCVEGRAAVTAMGA